jgi:UDP-N-acetyl-D-mannosaminuronic acid dehydrogenase
MAVEKFTTDVGIIGGGGHVGLPLALVLADSGLRTAIYDINASVVETIQAGVMPFSEEGAPELLKKVLAKKTLTAHTTADCLKQCRFLILIIGTPVDEHLNPEFNAIHRAIDRCADNLRDGQILILRSTIYPGISEHIQQYLRRKSLDINVAFCPERVAQGYSLREIRELPQIVSAFDRETLAEVSALFGRLTKDIVEMEPKEAELTKLMTNAWRYIQFATINQFYMIASQNNLDFNRILHGCRHKYPRMAGMPGPGFAAGPCLVKDTMQLAAFSHNTFIIGHAAMLINEGLPNHLVQMALREGGMHDKTAAILGMAFKAESDDPRDSLSYKLKKLLTLQVKEVLCTDPYVKDKSFVPLDEALKADVIFIGTPHKAYKQLVLAKEKRLIDIWNCVARDA